MLIYDIEEKELQAKSEDRRTILVGHQSSSTLRSPAESCCSSNRQLTDLRLGRQISVP